MDYRCKPRGRCLATAVGYLRSVARWVKFVGFGYDVLMGIEVLRQDGCNDLRYLYTFLKLS